MRQELFKPYLTLKSWKTLYALLEHKQVSRGLESNGRESLNTKNPIEVACSARIGKTSVLCFLQVYGLRQYFHNTNRTS